MTRVLFFGTPEFSAICLRELLLTKEISVVGVITNPDRPAGRGKAMTESPVKTLALSHGIPIIQPPSIKKSLNDFMGSLLAFGDIDIGVVVAFGQILPKEVLEYPKAGCINVHASLLPRWRGAAPIQRAIMSGDTKTGICLMKMAEGLDTGDIYSTEELKISKDDTFQSIHDQLANIGSRLLSRDLLKIVSGNIPAVPQSNVGLTYAEKIKNSEALIDWSKSAAEIHNQIRGLSPIPGAFTQYGGLRLKIFSTRLLTDAVSSAPSRAGDITLCSGNDFRVACGIGELALEEVQLEGRKRLTIGEFTKGVPNEIHRLGES